MSRCDHFHSVNCLFEQTLGGSPIKTGSSKEPRKFYSSVRFTPLYQSVDPVPVLEFKRHQLKITAQKNDALEILKNCA